MNVTLNEFQAGMEQEKLRRKKRRDAEYFSYVKRKFHANPTSTLRKEAFYSRTAQPLLLLKEMRKGTRS